MVGLSRLRAITGRNGAVRRLLLLAAAASALQGCALTRQFVYAPPHAQVALEPGPTGLPLPLQVTTDDGIALSGYRWAGTPGDRDVAIFFHGRHWNAEMGANAARYLTGTGDAVIVASYRGFGNNAGAPSEAGLLRDAAAFIAAARALGGPDARIWLVGHSLGAAVALEAAAQDERVRGVIALSSFVRIAEAAPPITRGLIPDRWDNDAALARLHVPVIFVQGALDRFLPADSAARLIAAYPGPARLIVGQQSRHNPDMAVIGPWLRAAIDTMAEGPLDGLQPPPAGWIETARKP